MMPRRHIRSRAILALRKANRLMEAGDYQAAAQIYERLARGAKNRGFHKQAPHLFLQAARARMLSSQPKRGVELLFEGFEILKSTNRWNFLRNSGETAVKQLEDSGEQELAKEVEGWLENALKEHPPTSVMDQYESYSRSQRGSIPPNCPNCGASLRPKEIEWLDSRMVECLYCGSSIPTVR